MVPAQLEEEVENEAEVEDENEGRSGFVIGARPPVAALRPNSYEVRIERVQRDIYDFFLSNTDHEIEVHSLPSYFPGRDGEWVRLKGKSRKAVKAKQPQTGDYSQSWAHHIRYVNTECSSPLSREFTSIKPNALFYAIILDTWSRTGNNIGYVGYVGAAFKSVEKQLQSHKRAAKKILRFYQHLVAEGRPFEPSPSTSLFEHLVARVFLGEGELVNTVAVFTIYTKEEEDEEDEAPGESQRLSQVVDGPPLDGSPSKTKRRRRKKEDRSPEEEKADRERKLQQKKERKELKRLAQSKVEQFALAGLLGANRH